MNNFLSSKKISDFAAKFGLDEIIKANKIIGRTLKFEPRVEYAVCANGACCYSPKNVSSMFSDWRSQKSECDKWLKDNKKRFPNGWVVKEGYKTTKLEYYPNFHLDWNSLIEAMRRVLKKDKVLAIYIDDIFITWEAVYNAVKSI